MKNKNISEKQENLFGLRASSTRLLERDLVTGKRFFDKLRPAYRIKEQKKAEGKEPIYLNNLGKKKPEADASKGLKRLEILSKLKTGQKANRLWNLMKEETLWFAAYAKLAKNPGSTTSASTEESNPTIDGYSKKVLNTLRQQVTGGKYRQGIAKRLHISKPQKELRPLTIPAFRDRVMQEVLRTILETVFEPHFYNESHGFRPYRSQHTCLRHIRRDFNRTKWIIEGDISRCFDKINHCKLIKRLKMHIKDNRFMEFLQQILNTPVYIDKQIVSHKQGTPQGGICSPILSNIVLHALDKLMKRLKKKVDKGTKRKNNAEYSKRLRKVIKVKKQKNINQAEKTKQMRKLYTELRRVPASDPMDPEFRRLSYVRYADDFLVGVIGSRQLAMRIKTIIGRVLKRSTGLELNQNKTHISRVKKNGVKFLGYSIRQGSKIKSRILPKAGSKVKGKIMIREGNLKLMADTNRIINTLANKGFCKKNGEAIPNLKLVLDLQSDTVAQTGAIIRGIDQYYKLANNRRRNTSRIMSILRSSTAKLFAAKFKLKTQAKVYAKAGKDLSKPLNNKSVLGITDAIAQTWFKQAGGQITEAMPKIPFIRYNMIPKPDLASLSRNWCASLEPKQSHLDYVESITIRSGRGKTALNAACAMCASTQDIEIHHVRALKDLKGKHSIEKYMITINRKSISLCSSCHLKIHGKSKRKKLL